MGDPRTFLLAKGYGSLRVLMILDCVDARETPDFKEEYKLPVGAEVGLGGNNSSHFSVNQ